MKKSWILAAITMLPIATQAACPLDEVVRIPKAGWLSQQIFAEISGNIIEANGCKVEYFTGSSAAQIAELQKGDAHVAPEIWVDNIRDLFMGEVATGNWMPLRPVSEQAKQGAFIPRYIQEKYPDLVYVSDLKRYKDVFQDPEEPGKAVIMLV